MQVNLSDDLYRAVKERQLPASELLQEAVRGELRRGEVADEAATYLDELIAEVGQPSDEDLEWAEAIAARARAHAAANRVS